jgi:hypothetical protein
MQGDLALRCDDVKNYACTISELDWRSFWLFAYEAYVNLRQERKLFIFRKNYFPDRNYCLDLLVQSAKLPESVNGYYNPGQSLIPSAKDGEDCSTFTMVSKLPGGDICENEKLSCNHYSRPWL